MIDPGIHKKVVLYLRQLGLNTEQAKIYLFLLESGGASVLAISRHLKTGRTKLYPLMEELAAKQLVTVHERHYGTSYEALPPESLEFLVSEHEAKSGALRANLPGVMQALHALHGTSPEGTRLVEYRGLDGLKQMNFNLAKASSEFRVFEQANLDKHQGIPRYFAEKMRALYVERNLIGYDLTNNPDWHVDTKISGFEKVSRARYIDPKVFTIEFESYVYDNCIGMLNYDQNDIFGVEIYNPALARQQRTLFDLVWKMAKPLPLKF